MGAETAKLKVIITGATGMVGEGVLLECLEHPAIERVLMVNRRSYPLQHPNLQAFRSQLAGYDACFFCAGISSRGMSELAYYRITYEVTIHFAQELARLNSEMVFVYVSGALTDSSEKGRVMWARVKGKTENALQRLGFRNVYSFRPGFMKPTPGQRNIQWYYGAIGWLYPILHLLLPNQVSTMREVGLAMIHSVVTGYPKSILEIKDINALAKA